MIVADCFSVACDGVPNCLEGDLSDENGCKFFNTNFTIFSRILDFLLKKLVKIVGTLFISLYVCI